MISLSALSAMSALFLVGCGLEQLTQNGANKSGSAASGSDAGADSGVLGAGCGIESGSRVQLCQATSACPKLVVDTQAFPHCGFRIQGGSSQLLCACGTSICSMGAYTTCAQATKLLASQTESQVCNQLAEERCSLGAPPVEDTSTIKSPCDRTCLKDCGGGAGCASLCGC